MRIANREIKVGEEVLQFAVVSPKENEGAAFLSHEWCYFVIVVALVRATQDEYDGRLHTFKRTIASVDVGRFRVVNIMHAGYVCYLLKAMRHTGEVGQAGADCCLIYAR